MERPQLPFLQQIRDREAVLEPVFANRFYRDAGIRVYAANLTEEEIINSTDEESLRNIIIPRLDHAEYTRPAMTEGADINIRFRIVYELNGQRAYKWKGFESRKPEDIERFFRDVRVWNENVHGMNEDYTNSIDRIVINIVKEQEGGCNPNGKDKKFKTGNTIRTAPKLTKDNNCFFKCVKKLIVGKGRLSAKRCNDIRQKYGLESNTSIPVSIGLKIAKEYGFDLQIVGEDMLLYGTPGGVVLDLTDGHYTIVTTKEVKPNQTCDKCGTSYKTKHKCNLSKTQFYQSKRDGIRRLIARSQSGKKQTELIHYDLETYQKTLTSGEIVQSVYIVGFNDNDNFQYFAGDDCMELFLNYLLNKKHAITLNAYNGSKFDHYFLYAEMLRRGLKVEKLLLNNGAIIGLKYKNISTFDLCKHLMGSLDQNLKALKCQTQKGDFDHDQACRWEEMDDELKQDCLKYLKGDVMGLRELYNKINASILDEHDVEVKDFISTSSLTYQCWVKSISKQYDIHLPNAQQEEGFRASIRGGRTYPSKHQFKSSQYDSFKSGEIDFKKIKDFLIDADVVSLYPASMLEEFPVGRCLKLPKDYNGTKGKMGIYKIRYSPNKSLAHSVGGRRDMHGALHWDLEDSEGWYTSVDIEDMMSNGYKVEILDGWYWTETEPVFKDYINQLFQKKKQATKGTSTYLLAKLFMNSLYGKTIQRPIYEQTKIINTNSEYWKFYGKHKVTDVQMVEREIDGDIKRQWWLTGVPRDLSKVEKLISKPTQFGAFILAYSRRIMLNYMKEANPWFDKSGKEQINNDIYYTDTDSLQMHQTCANKIKRLGDKSLGGITDDLGDGCKIVRGIWIAPKLYALHYLKQEEDGSISEHYHYRGKGLNTGTLSWGIYEQMLSGKSYTNTRAFQMTKINFKINSKQKAQGFQEFQIKYTTNIKKIVNQEAWTGRKFDGNDSLPWGHINII